MLSVEPSISGQTRIVVLRIPPPIEQITAHPLGSATVTGRLGASSTVVDHPDLIDGPHTDDNLIQLGVVIDRVAMEPVGTLVSDRVDISQFRMVGHNAEVLLGGIEILNQMIPRMPLPDDFARTRTRLSHLDDVIRPQLIVVEQ